MFEDDEYTVGTGRVISNTKQAKVAFEVTVMMRIFIPSLHWFRNCTYFEHHRLLL